MGGEGGHGAQGQGPTLIWFPLGAWERAQKKRSQTGYAGLRKLRKEKRMRDRISPHVEQPILGETPWRLACLQTLKFHPGHKKIKEF